MATEYQFENNASSLLVAAINTLDTSVQITAGDGGTKFSFPSLSANKPAMLVLFDASLNYEIVKATARSADTFTIVRAQEGTTARSWSIGDGLALRPTQQVLEAFLQKAADNLLTGVNNFEGAVTYAASAGTDTYTASLTPALTAYNDGATYNIRFGNANTSTAPTLNVNGLGAKTIKKCAKTGVIALEVGDIGASHDAVLRYDGTDLILLNPVLRKASLNLGTPDGAANSVEIGAGATGDRDVTVDLVGDTTYTDFGARIKRTGGANGATDIKHRGTGALTVSADDAASVKISTNGTERIEVDSAGAITTGNATAATGYTSAGAITLPTTEGVYAKNGVKAWARINYSGGTPSLGGNWRVTSVTDNGVGDITVTFDDIATYSAACVIATAHSTTAGLFVGVYATSAITISMKIRNRSDVLTDPDSLSLIVLHA